MRNMLFFASHESRRSCKTEFRDRSVSDLSASRSRRFLYQDLRRENQISDPRRIRLGSETRAFWFYARGPVIFVPAMLYKTPVMTDPSRIRTSIRICKTVENHALLANHKILIVLISTNNSQMIKVRADFKSHKNQLFKYRSGVKSALFHEICDLPNVWPDLSREHTSTISIEEMIQKVKI